MSFQHCHVNGMVLMIMCSIARVLRASSCMHVRVLQMSAPIVLVVQQSPYWMQLRGAPVHALGIMPEQQQTVPVSLPRWRPPSRLHQEPRNFQTLLEKATNKWRSLYIFM